MLFIYLAAISFAKFVMHIEKILNDKEIFSIYMDFDNAETSSKF